MEFRYVNDPALKIACDVLAFGVFGDPGRDPLFKSATWGRERQHGISKTVGASATYSFSGP